MIGLSLSSSVSKHTLWSYYDWVYCCCRPSVCTISGRIMIGLSLLSSVSKHTMWSHYDWVYCCCRPSVNTICGRIMIGLSLLSSVSKHNVWSYYDWFYCCCRPSVNTICGRIMIGLSLSFVSKHNMWSCYDWVVVVVFRLLTQYVVVFWLGCRCCRPSVNTICGRIMIGLSLSSVSKHNMWSCYDSVVVVVVRQ
jgi:hypothetical protein